MKLFEFQQKMRNQTFPKFMVFVGCEYKIKDLYVRQLSKITDTSIVNIDTCSTLLAIGKVTSLLGNRCLYVCKYDKGILSSTKYWDSISSKLGNNLLVLYYEDIDSKSKFYNKFKDNIVEFTKQQEETVKLMLQPYQIKPEILDYLVKQYECNYSYIVNELDKVQHYAKAKNISINDAIIEGQDTLCFVKNTEIQQLTEQLLSRNPKIFATLNKLKSSGESVIKILGYIYNAFRQQLIVQTCYATPQSTGLPQFVITSLYKTVNVYSTQKLKKNLSLIQDVEQGSKNGKYDEDYALDYLVTSLL